MSKQIDKNSEKKKISIIRSALIELKKQDIDFLDILKYISQTKEKKIEVPVSIFRSGSPLYVLVKYLVENKGFRYYEIAKILGRDQRTIGNVYRTSKEKCKKFELESKYYVSVELFCDRSLSVLEHLCLHLMKEFGLSYHDIAVILSKDDRTIWTVINRARKKWKKI